MLNGPEIRDPLEGVDPAETSVPDTIDVGNMKVPRGEIGISGLSRFGYDVSEEFLTSLRWPRAGKVFKEMSYNDPVIGAILLVAKMLVRTCSWKVPPISSKTEDQQAAEFVDQCRGDMFHSWGDFIAEVLSMLPYGWAWHEIVYKKREGYSRDRKVSSKYKDGRIGWSRLAGRAQDTLYGWNFDEFGDVNAMIQQAPPDYKIRTMPSTKSLHFRTEVERNNPEGRSMLRNAYRPWYFKKRIEEIEGIGIERDLAGLPVLTAPESLDIWNPDNEEARQILHKAERLVRNIRRDQNEGVVKPFGWDLQLLSAGGRRNFDTNAILNRYDQRIAITMLSDIVMLGGDKVGSFALANVKKSILATSLESIVDMIVDVFNREAIPRLFAVNTFHDLTDFPKLEHGEIEAPDLIELGRYIQSLSGAGMPLFPDEGLEDYLRERASMPKSAGTAVSRFEAQKQNQDDEKGTGFPAGNPDDGGMNRR